MALIKCVECGKEISDKAPACIHCGCPISVNQNKQINTNTFQDLFAGSVSNSSAAHAATLVCHFNARVQGPPTDKTEQAVHVKSLNQTFRFHVPNTIQPGQSIRLIGKGQMGPDGKQGDILFTVDSVVSAAPQPDAPQYTPPQPAAPQPAAPQPAAPQYTAPQGAPFSPAAGPDMSARVASFKAKRQRALVIPVVCLFICVISLLIARITLCPYLVIPFFITFFPAIVGLCKLLAILFGDKARRSVQRLEERGLLGQMLLELDRGQHVPFGDKASLSDRFLFRNNGKGIVLACDDILWVYTRRGNRYENLMLGTKHLGVVTLSGQDASLAGMLNKYKEKLLASITELQRRNPGVLVGNSPENKAKYEAMREK